MPLRRKEMAVAILSGALTKSQAVRIYAVSHKVVSRWVARFKQGGRARHGRLLVATQKQSPAKRYLFVRAHCRASPPAPDRQAHCHGNRGVTVSRVLRRPGLSRMKDIAPAEPVVRCEYKEPGGLKHIRTKPYTPKTTGKAERFIQTALREWAYARACPTSENRKAHLPEWTHVYNWQRPHGGINSKTPVSRLALNRDNLLRLHIYNPAALVRLTRNLSRLR